MKLRLCFLWHMHQPYYKDPETDAYILPWVRLHAVKDYVALPRIFRRFPKVRHTFNLVPSLLVQVRDYVEHGAEDLFLSVSRKNALDLTREEELFLLRNFFSANPGTMILPHPRYAELFNRRDAAIRAVGRGATPGGFGASEYTDLATLFNLAWIHPLHREEDGELARLYRKEGGFTEREKTLVLDRQIEIMGSVIPEYRRLVGQDGGELSSSPMYHPILPLLIDSRAAQDALPGAQLPSLPFSYPEDALEQLRKGREVFRGFFGRDPAGLWPPEGSINPAAMELAAGMGYRWAATDEILLAKATGKAVYRDFDGVPQDPGWLYRPYAASTPSGEISLLFRDHHLSDLIGFEYSRWGPVDAANNFVNIISKIYSKLSSIDYASRKESYVVPVILDGENAWEYFPDSGEAFLSALMDRLGSLSPAIECIPVTEAIERSGEPEPLPGIPTGSWIDGTFSIWIGHREDHEAWDMLSRARALWQRHYEKAKRSGIELPESLAAAREHLLVAEGSDWCWWYGEEHFTPHGPEFDRLFRKRIKAAYRELGETAPDSLDIPIVRPDKIPSVKNFLPSPRGYIRPRINGKLTSYFEWSIATRYVPAPEFGTMHRSGTAAMTCLHYGFDESTLYLRIDLHHRIFEPPANPVELEFLFPGKNRKVHLLLYPAEKAVRCAIGTIGEVLSEKPAPTMPDAFKAAFHKVLELGIPFRELGCEGENQIGFFLTIRPQGSVGERYPTYGQFTADLPGSDFEERMWEV
ncbi:MAG TPA: glycoside hydrolase [Deltaproteobacteria bacterium]|nr:glycoside hydrolase [Deltaproteobacteria bacterium]